MKNVLIIYGGKSCEHDISIITACLAKGYFANHNVYCVYLDKSNRAFLAPNGLSPAQHVECGRILGSVCDVAVVLGANRKYLAEGLRQTSCKVLFAKSLKQAVALAQPYLNGENSLLLFQNDLPD